MSRNHRRSWLLIHRCLGLSVGAIFVLTALSGSLIVFGWPIDAWLSRDIMTVEAARGAMPGRPVSEILAAAKAVIPGNARIVGYAFPRGASGVFRVNYTIPGARNGYEVFVHPRTARVLGQRLWGDFDPCCSWHGPLMAVIYRFHDSFWLGETGLTAVGAVGLAMLVAGIGGVILWWPSAQRAKALVRVRWGARSEQLCFDLHNVFGLLFAPVLLMVLVTGVYLSFPQQARALLGMLSPLGASAPAAVQTGNLGRTERLSVDQLVAIAAATGPVGKLDYVTLPDDEGGLFQVSKHAGDEPLSANSRYTLQFDPFDGSLRHVAGAGRRSVGDRVDEWILALHSGEGLGLAGQILVCLSGIAPLMLFGTGFIRWRQKRGARMRRCREGLSPHLGTVGRRHATQGSFAPDRRQFVRKDNNRLPPSS